MDFCASCPEKFLALVGLVSRRRGMSSRILKGGRRHHARGGIWDIFNCFGVFYLINEIPEGKGASTTIPFLSVQVSPVHVSEKKKENIFIILHF